MILGAGKYREDLPTGDKITVPCRKARNVFSLSQYCGALYLDFANEV